MFTIFRIAPDHGATVSNPDRGKVADDTLEIRMAKTKRPVGLLVRRAVLDSYLIGLRATVADGYLNDGFAYVLSAQVLKERGYEAQARRG